MNIFTQEFIDQITKVLNQEIDENKNRPIPISEFQEIFEFHFGKVWWQYFGQSTIDCCRHNIVTNLANKISFNSAGKLAGFYRTGANIASSQSSFSGEPLLFKRKLEKAKDICEMHTKFGSGLAVNFVVEKLMEPNSKKDDKRRMLEEFQKALDSGMLPGFKRTESMILRKEA